VDVIGILLPGIGQFNLCIFPEKRVPDIAITMMGEGLLIDAGMPQSVSRSLSLRRFSLLGTAPSPIDNLALNIYHSLKAPDVSDILPGFQDHGIQHPYWFVNLFSGGQKIRIHDQIANTMCMIFLKGVTLQPCFDRADGNF